MIIGLEITAITDLNIHLSFSFLGTNNVVLPSIAIVNRDYFDASHILAFIIHMLCTGVIDKKIDFDVYLMLDVDDVSYHYSIKQNNDEFSEVLKSKETIFSNHNGKILFNHQYHHHTVNTAIIDQKKLILTQLSSEIIPENLVKSLQNISIVKINMSNMNQQFTHKMIHSFYILDDISLKSYFSIDQIYLLQYKDHHTIFTTALNEFEGIYDDEFIDRKYRLGCFDVK